MREGEEGGVQRRDQKERKDKGGGGDNPLSNRDPVNIIPLMFPLLIGGVYQ